MLWKTLPYMIGIVVADYWAGSIWPFLLSATAITVACSFFKPSRVAGWAAMLFAIGFANQTFHLRHFSADVGAAHKINTNLSGLNGCPILHSKKLAVFARF